MFTSPKTSFNQFHSPTYGLVGFEGMVDLVLDYIKSAPGFEYDLIIGTDSLATNGVGKSSADMVSAVVIHRKSRGGIYFWAKWSQYNLFTLRDRIYEEALSSMRLGEQLLKSLKQREVTDLNLVIHIDIGPNGETKKMLQEIVGMVRGNGFAVKTKPESYGASSVADRHT